MRKDSNMFRNCQTLQRTMMGQEKICTFAVLVVDRQDERAGEC